MTLTRFSTIVLAIAAAAQLPIGQIGDGDGRNAASLGSALAAANAIAAFALVAWAHGRSTRAFLVAVLGGSGLRLLLLLSAFGFAIGPGELPALPLAGSIGAHLIVYWTLEAVALHRGPSVPLEAR